VSLATDVPGGQVGQPAPSPNTMTGSGGLAAVHAQHIGNHVEHLANIAAAVAAFTDGRGSRNPAQHLANICGGSSGGASG
jgi:hypothetical protein